MAFGCQLPASDAWQKNSKDGGQLIMVHDFLLEVLVRSCFTPSLPAKQPTYVQPLTAMRSSLQPTAVALIPVHT